MKKFRYLLIFVFLLAFSHLAYAATPATVMPNLIGTWKGTTTQVGSTTAVNVTLTLTTAVAAPVPNMMFSGTLAIGAETVNVFAKNQREFYKVEITPQDSQVPLSVGSSLAWLPGPMLLIHGMGFNNKPYKSFILKKTTP